VFPLLVTQFARLDERIEREIRRMRARYELSLDEFRGLYVSDEQVDRLVEQRHEPSEAHAVVNSAPAASPQRQHVSAGASEENPRWRELSTRFALSPLEQDLLLIGTACDSDLRYETLFAYLNNDVTRKWPTIDLVQRLLRDIASAADMLFHTSPDSNLHARGLLRLIDPPSGRPSCLNRGYSIHPGVAHWLYGHSGAAALDHPAIEWVPAAALGAIDSAGAAVSAPIVRILERGVGDSGSLPAIALLGREGSGRAASAAAAARITARPLVLIDRRKLSCRADDAERDLRSLTVSLTLEPAIVVIRGFDADTDEHGAALRHDVELVNAIAKWPASTAVLFRTDRGERWRSFAVSRRVVELHCDDTPVHRFALWREASIEAGIDLPEAEVRGLAGRYVLAPGKVRAAMATARDVATLQGVDCPRAVHVGAAARLVSDEGLGRLATKIERTYRWDDLVLPKHTVQRLRELAASIRNRETVYGEWGFARRLNAGSGVKALFAGASGTGKTMAAGVVAHELELDLYKVDLSGVISKYIGETEKNLDRIFTGARAASAILFLDEAEALLGRRSEVKDSHDRYANIEVAYLLQKLEEHEGVVVLATNLRRNIDEAFNRRLQYVIDFPKPQEAERERLWRQMFPPQSPLVDGIDFGFLARQFDLAGGDIRNIALEAAFLAADDGGVIGMRPIVRALAHQLAKQGKTPTGSDFYQYQCLLGTG
jgi:AAA+ superfamily predicted ATPase